MTPAKPKLPTFKSYGPYISSNYGAHALVFTDHRGFRFYFSYQTLVGFERYGETVVRQNEWGPTTGKHLNAIDGGDKKSRVDEATFEAKLSAALAEAEDNEPRTRLLQASKALLDNWGKNLTEYAQGLAAAVKAVEEVRT